MKGFLVEIPSSLGFDNTVDSIVKEAERQNWKIPAVHDLQQTLAKSGKFVMPVRVIELCKPAYSGKILEQNHERALSVMMPCRISVYEKEDGKTYISVIDVEAFAGFLPESTSVYMVDAANESLQIVNTAIGRD